MQERKDQRMMGLHGRQGMAEGKEERRAGLCLRKGKGKRMAQRKADGCFPASTACRLGGAGNIFNLMEVLSTGMTREMWKTEQLRAEDRGFQWGNRRSGWLYPVLSRQL